MNLAHWLQRTAAIHPHAAAVAHGNRVVYRYAELALSAARTAAWLRQHRVGPADRVGLFMDNHPDYLPKNNYGKVLKTVLREQESRLPAHQAAARPQQTD